MADQPRRNTPAGDLAYNDMDLCSKSESEFWRNAPKFSGGYGDSWDRFINNFRNVSRRFTTSRPHYKATLFNCLEGEAYTLAHPRYDPHRETYRNMTCDQYADVLKNLFEPESEASLRMSTYLARVQLPNEHAGNYFSAKLSAFEKAFPVENQRPWMEFYEHTARGFVNDTLKAMVRRFVPNPIDNTDAYRNNILNEVGILQRRYLAHELSDADIIGCEIQTALGSSGMYRTAEQQLGIKQERLQIKPERIQAVPTGQEDRTCYYCSNKGHLYATCPRRLAGLPKVVSLDATPAAPQKKRFPLILRKKNNPSKGYRGKPSRRPRISVVQNDDGTFYGEWDTDEEDADEEGDQEEDDAENELIAALTACEMDRPHTAPTTSRPPPGVNAVATEVNYALPGSSPTGYMAINTPQGVTAHALVDSGNLFGDLISKEFADLMQLEITGPTSRSQTADPNGHVTILGTVPEFQFTVPGLPNPLTIQPKVAEDLAQDVNLGVEFLCRYEAGLDFHLEGARLQIDNQVIDLHSTPRPATVNALGQRVRTMYFKVYATQSTWLTAYNTTWIQVKPDWEGMRRLPCGEVRLYAAEESYGARQEWTVHKDIDVQVGPYQFDGDAFNVQVTSHSRGGLHIAPGALIGEVCSSQGTAEFGVFTLSPAPTSDQDPLLGQMDQPEATIEGDCPSPFSPAGIEYLSRNILRSPSPGGATAEPAALTNGPGPLAPPSVQTAEPTQQPDASREPQPTSIRPPLFLTHLYAMLSCLRPYCSPLAEEPADRTEDGTAPSRLPSTTPPVAPTTTQPTARLPQELRMAAGSELAPAWPRFLNQASPATNPDPWMENSTSYRSQVPPLPRHCTQSNGPPCPTLKENRRRHSVPLYFDDRGYLRGTNLGNHGASSQSRRRRA